MQLRPGSLYSNLRTLVPVVTLGAVWLFVTRAWQATDLHLWLDQTVSVRHLLLAIAIATLWNVWFSLSQYTVATARRDLSAELWRFTAAACACGLLPFAANILRGLFARGILLAELTTLGLLFCSYLLIGLFLLGALLSPHLRRKRLALIVGSGDRAAQLRQRLDHHYARLQIYGCLDDEYVGEDAHADCYLGPISLLPGLLKDHPIEVVLIGLPIKSKYDVIQRVIDNCELMGVESQYMHDFFETVRAPVRNHRQEPTRFAVVGASPGNPRQYLKRAFDLFAGLLLVLLFAPVMMLAALAVRLSSPGPILFVQQRYGLHRRRFPMFKFRSMVADAESRQAALETANEAGGPVFKLRRDPRITRVGAFLRRTSIDELPQLFNVLRGEMSLVGPRPLPLRDVSRFEEAWLLRRFSVRPGLTCLWQVKGRSDTTFDTWIKLDLAYIDTWSLALDVKILFLTIPAVLKGSGAV